ncbi:tetraacyldisaccharide 4'-kinase [Psychromonas antarctica]|uniref:tetraacyldisaccharide 4'-kinase n=1 Tax=Psychromonas antarctica TaxID=67573 RepID=UPI001EE83885|nr:tetraacyldisaccharide 4'-kinase [Psychromonas antarctica]MCG6199998.1 tetraacyldisaccharide 4'-kinase [Psychromonas antarctica]
MRFWYQAIHWWGWFLYPFSLLFAGITLVRRFVYKKALIKSTENRLPVIVVGNISVGGNGKTPFVIWLCELLIEQGYKPGIISRGYGGKSEVYPLLVDEEVTGKQAGDEPVMIFKRLGLPIVVDPRRSAAAAYLSKHCAVDIIISDDGLQHYALQRDIEIVVVDGQRRFGNGHLMPMGPLREPLSRLKEVDFIINNGQLHADEITMLLAPSRCLRVDGADALLPLNCTINACAAIGYPQRFFDTLNRQHFTIHKAIAFADHYAFSEGDFTQFEPHLPLLMTEKDAVKCTTFAQKNWWYLPIDAQLPVFFEKQLLDKIKEIR